MDIKKMPKNAEKFNCEYCNFKCYKQSNYNKHIITPKHKNNEKRYKMVNKNADENIEEFEKYKCDCGNIYKHYSGLYRHKKKCQKEEKIDSDKIIVDSENNISSDLIIEIIKQNQ